MVFCNSGDLDFLSFLKLGIPQLRSEATFLSVSMNGLVPEYVCSNTQAKVANSMLGEWMKCWGWRGNHSGQPREALSLRGIWGFVV